MNAAEKIEKQQEAKEAGYLESKLRPIFNQIEDRLISDIKGAFRSGSKDDVELRVKVGTLCAMDDLRNILNQKIERAKTGEGESDDRRTSSFRESYFEED